MILERASLSHTGLVRRNNEDALAECIPDAAAPHARKGALFVAADGVGGQAAGEVASRMAADALVEEYYSPRAPHQIEAALKQAATAANLRVYNLAHGKDTALRGMQTTLTALVLAGRQAYVAHAGDTRLYRWRAGQLAQLTGDHSEAADLLRLRLISEEQARDHPRRSVLTRALGGNPLLRPDFARQPVQAGDRYLLCTDGLWGEVEQQALCDLLALHPREACPRLVDLACERGGSDNISLHVVHVVEPDEEPAAPPGRIARLLSGLRGG